MHRWGRIAVIFALAIPACSSSNGGDGAPGTTAATSEDAGTSPATSDPVDTIGADTTSSVAPPAGTSSLTAADGSPVAGALFSIVTEAVLRPAGFTPASRPVDVVVADGLVTAPARLSLSGSAPPDGALPMLLHRNDLGSWEAVPADYVSGSYAADVGSFSWYWPGWATDATGWVTTTAGGVVDAAGNIIDSGFDWVTGRTDPPRPCGSDPYPWVLSAGGPADGAFHVCLDQNPRADGTERVEVKIKSNRAFAMWVVVPRDGADYVWVEGSSWDLIGPAMLAFTGGDNSRVLVGAGRTVTVGYTQPAVAASYSFYAYQDNLTQIFSLISRIAGEANAELGTLLSVISCFDNGMPTIANLTWDAAWGCLDEMLGATADKVDSAIGRAIAAGRVALSAADREAFGAAVLRSNRLSRTSASIKKVAKTLGLARLAADAVVLAADAAAAMVDGAGGLTVELTSLHGSDCLDPVLAQQLVEPWIEGVTSAQIDDCYPNRVAVGTAFVESNEAATAAWAFDGANWHFLAASFGIRSVCEAVWRIDVTIDAGCGTNFTWAYPTYFEVPQLGSDPVRGSGCGAHGDLGDTIPDGVWNGYIATIGANSLELDVVCVFYGESAAPFVQQFIDEYGYEPAFGDTFFTVNNTIRTRTVPLASSFVHRDAEWTDGTCLDPGPSHDVLASNDLYTVIDSWVVVQGGQAVFALTSCPYG